MTLALFIFGLLSILAGAALIHPGAALVVFGMALVRAAKTLEGDPV